MPFISETNEGFLEKRPIADLGRKRIRPGTSSITKQGNHGRLLSSTDLVAMLSQCWCDEEPSRVEEGCTKRFSDSAAITELESESKPSALSTTPHRCAPYKGAGTTL